MLKYLIGRIVPGVANLLLLYLLGTMMSAEDYTNYNYILVVAGLLCIFGIEWLSLATLRFSYQLNEGSAQSFQGTLIIATALTILGVLVPASIILSIAVFNNWMLVPLVVSQATFQISRDFLIARQCAGAYGKVVAVNALVTLACALLFVSAGLGVQGAIFGQIAGFLGGIIAFFYSSVDGIIRPLRVPVLFDRKLFKNFLSYGIPLSATVFCLYIVNYVDRVFLFYFASPKATALYSVVYDMIERTIGMLFGVVGMATFPQAVKLFEKKNTAALSIHLECSLLYIVSIGLPFVCGIVLLTPFLSAFIVPSHLLPVEEWLFPAIGLSIFIAGLKARYFDYGFQLTGNTYTQLRILAIAAAINVAICALLIPLYQTLGAVTATLISFGLALGLTITTNTGLDMPIPWARTGGLLCITLVSCITSAGLVGIPNSSSLIGGIAFIIIFLTTYILLVSCLVLFTPMDLSVESKKQTEL
jgi:O-antigen/teichoic acid export membrane protein